MKHGVTKSKELLCKLKLKDNLTTGESDTDRIVWRFTLAPNEKVTRSLYLLDIGSSVSFDCRIASREVKMNR